jgi:uncharacterized protein YbgA (DUF1722 family)/uncharacterized protein YbbK (DUF523 family)
MNSLIQSRLVLGVSSCLLGQRVRYDGAARRDGYIVDTLSPYVEFVPICPEVEIGMGVPRPPVQLVGNPAHPHMRGVADPGADFTMQMQTFAGSVAPRIERISGYIFKSRSPSCGVWDTPIHADDGSVTSYGTGLFVRGIVKHSPFLPLQDERALQAPEVRDHFFEQVFSYREWQDQVAPAPSLAALREFHVSHKYSLLAHHQASYRALGRMLAAATMSSVFVAQYAAQFFATLRKPATRATHANVLQHVLGYFKKSAIHAERYSTQQLISSYRGGAIELSVVLQELRALNARYPNAYLLKQRYLYPVADDYFLARGANSWSTEASAAPEHSAASDV